MQKQSFRIKDSNMTEFSKDIVIKGARENNLKSMDVTIPRNKLVVLELVLWLSTVQMLSVTTITIPSLPHQASRQRL